MGWGICALENFGASDFTIVVEGHHKVAWACIAGDVVRGWRGGEQKAQGFACGILGRKDTVWVSRERFREGEERPGVGERKGLGSGRWMGCVLEKKGRTSQHGDAPESDQPADESGLHENQWLRGWKS